jgi:hypothetical protein
MFFGQVRQKELLPCIICSKRFSVDDVEKGQYFASTFICRGCYEEMQKKSYSESCFGKATVQKKGLVLYGYSKKSLVCSKICPDREPCKLFVLGEVHSDKVEELEIA